MSLKTVSPEQYAHVLPRVRRSWLRRRANEAEWTVPDGPLGDVVVQLRHRGEVARRRSFWIFQLLLAVIVLGIAFYLGQPFFRLFADGQRVALQQTQNNSAEAVENLRKDLDALAAA